MHKNTQRVHSGFSLVELMVSISIVVLVMGVVLARHTKSNGAVLLRSQAYEVAFTAREVQLSAVSASSDAGVYRNVLGVYFNTSVPNAFTVFKDTTGTTNYFFDTGEEFGLQGVIDKRFTLDAIRVVSGGVETPVAQIAVVFERPNFDARFYTGANTPVAASAVELDIRLKGATGNGVEAVRTVEITQTGQIVVQ